MTLYDRWFDDITRAAETVALKMPPDTIFHAKVVETSVSQGLENAPVSPADQHDSDEIEEAASAMLSTPLIPSPFAPTTP